VLRVRPTLLAVLVTVGLVLPATAFAGVFGAPVAPRIAGTLPAGFTGTTVWEGLGNPTVIRFAPDGRVFVATKGGVIYVFSGLEDTTPTVFADLRAKVHDFWDRGLLGLALDPGFATGRPYVYVAYSHDTKPWGDTCPDGGTKDGCIIDSRVSRLNAAGQETVLLEGFCQQFPSHSVGTLAFWTDGKLYLSAGEGAHFNFEDFGQIASNPCHDPPAPDGAIGPPDSQGGALRAQSFRRPAGQAVSLDGAILRLDPDTGAAPPDNPASGARARIVAYGFRNPFRFAFRPGTSEIYAGDVGWSDWEEINRIPDVSTVRNYGWPCYEGPERQPGYDAFDFDACESLYDDGSAVAPFFAYDHADPVVAGDGCGTGQSSMSAIAFYEGSLFPASYAGALFFGDYARGCIWVMRPGAGGVPDPATREPFEVGAAGPVFLTTGPDGALYYADLEGGTVRRIGFGEPTARIGATPDFGAAPLTVAFDGRSSSDQAGRALSYAWDLDGDGAYDDSTSATPSYRYDAPGEVRVRLRVTNTAGLHGRVARTITVGERPDVTISQPTTASRWAVGDTIQFAGSARDGSGALLPASRLVWSLVMRHCSRTDADECHSHAVEDYAGVSSGSFVAPDHEFPSHLELSLRATDADGLSSTATVELAPRTAEIVLATAPAGLMLSFGGESLPAPFSRTVLARSAISLNAPSPQSVDGVPYAWTGWSDGLAQTHTLTAPASGSISFTASYATPSAAPTEVATVVPTAVATVVPTAAATVAPTPVPTPVPTAAPSAAPRPVAAWGFDETAGTKARDASGHGRTGTLTGPLRVSAGRFGNALDFDGVDDWVTVRAPRVTSAMTVEAWVYPLSRRGSVAVRESARGSSWSLYPHEAGIGTRFARGGALKLRRWTHLAMTYDGATIRRYVNGVLAGSRARKGAVPSSSYPLRFGGNAVWREWFRGRLDEIRLYDRALSAAQIATDMTTPVNAAGPKVKRSKRPKGGAKVKRFRGSAKSRAN
jgi:glucose/arabinose dehydrogenase